MSYLVIIGILAYCFMIGLIGQVFYLRNMRRCGREHGSYSSHNHVTPALIIAVVWPISLTIFLGMVLADLLSHDSREARAAIKHRREQEKHNADVELKKLENERLRLDIEFLKANGVQVDYMVDANGMEPPPDRTELETEVESAQKRAAAWSMWKLGL